MARTNAGDTITDGIGGVHVMHCEDENPQAPEDDPENFWPEWWRSLLSRLDRPLDLVFASEAYGVRLARELGAEYIPVDPVRDTVPSSARQIREDPLKYGDYLLAEARPYYVKRVVVASPESSSKSNAPARGSARSP
jgi:HTH-type transcriptional repressor of NAD biosynthesis genes